MVTFPFPKQLALDFERKSSLHFVPYHQPVFCLKKINTCRIDKFEFFTWAGSSLLSCDTCTVPDILS